MLVYWSEKESVLMVVLSRVKSAYEFRLVRATFKANSTG